MYCWTSNERSQQELSTNKMIKIEEHHYCDTPGCREKTSHGYGDQCCHCGSDLCRSCVEDGRAFGYGTIAGSWTKYCRLCHELLIQQDDPLLKLWREANKLRDAMWSQLEEAETAIKKEYEDRSSTLQTEINKYLEQGSSEQQT